MGKGCACICFSKSINYQRENMVHSCVLANKLQGVIVSAFMACFESHTEKKAHTHTTNQLNLRLLQVLDSLGTVGICIIIA